MLSIIITHYKTPDLLKKCLDSIKTLGSVKTEIFVCDSQYEQSTKQMIENSYPWVHYIGFKDNVGYGKLVNAGLKSATGNYYLILNADIIVSSEGVLRMIEYMKNNQEIGILGPKLINIDGSFQNSCFRWYNFLTVLARRTFLGKTNIGNKILSNFLMQDYDKKTPKEVNWVMGSAFMTSAKAIKKVGGMDERFFMYFEDVDLCKRMWQSGFKVVYFPYAQFIHYHLKSSDTKGGILDIFTNRLTRVHIISYIKYTLKWLFK